MTDFKPLIVKAAVAWRMAGFTNETDFRNHVQGRLEPRFPAPLEPRQLPPRPGDATGTRRYARDEYLVSQIEDWAKARAIKTAEAAAQVEALLAEVHRKRSEANRGNRGRRAARRGRDGNNGPSCGESNAA